MIKPRDSFIIPGSRLITRMITIICSIIFRRLLLASYIPPLFLLAPEDLSNNTFAGGYYVSVESFGDSLLQLIHRVLEGEFPRDIPPAPEENLLLTSVIRLCSRMTYRFPFIRKRLCTLICLSASSSSIRRRF